MALRRAASVAKSRALEDLRLLHKRPGNGKPLLLAAGEIPSPLLQPEVQLPLFALYNFPGLGNLKGLP